jgi:hypothetical protein
MKKQTNTTNVCMGPSSLAKGYDPLYSSLVVAVTNQNSLYKKHMFCRENVNKIKMDEICRICHESLPKKHRRTIFGDTFSVAKMVWG